MAVTSAVDRGPHATHKPRNDVASRRPDVTAIATSARVCTLVGEGATNIDRSIVAVWGAGAAMCTARGGHPAPLDLPPSLTAHALEHNVKS
jgi:hypothetical protein